MATQREKITDKSKNLTPREEKLTSLLRQQWNHTALRSIGFGSMMSVTKTRFLIGFTAFSMMFLKFWYQETKLAGQLTEFLTEPELDFFKSKEERLWENGSGEDISGVTKDLVSVQGKGQSFLAATSSIKQHSPASIWKEYRYSIEGV